MKKLSLFFLIIIGWFISNCKGWAQENPQLLFQAGLYAEEVQGDLAKALISFQKIVKSYPNSRPVAAKALLHIGGCYEKLGLEKAQEAYQKIVDEYPDQRAIAVIARDKLAQIMSQPKPVDPLVRYYYERLGIDITTAYSWDGNYHAYTDWTDGNLFIKNISTNEKHQLTQVAWSKGHEYAYFPRWSRDDQYIAYSYYRQPDYIELRVVSLAEEKSRIIYSDPELLIFPHDWTPDDKHILCETYNFDRKDVNRLALISVDSLTLKELVSLSRNSMGMKISPDGEYVIFDVIAAAPRDICIFSLNNFKQTFIGGNLPGVGGYDTPVWSFDGKLILCRNSSTFDLWAMPIEDGKQSQLPFLVEKDLSKALLSMKKITHDQPAIIKNTRAKKRIHQQTPGSFNEEFSSPDLDSAWKVFEWRRPNVYDYPSFGRYSLTANPGHLRYYLDPIMCSEHNLTYAPYFSGWYWIYPSLEIRRPIYGNHWEIEAKVNFSMIDGANSRGFTLMLVLDPESRCENYLVIYRKNEIFEREGVSVNLKIRGLVIKKSEQFFSSKDLSGAINFTYFYRMTRTNNSIQVKVSEDGENYQQLFSTTLQPEQIDRTQTLAITGEAWFVPAGSFADWDYIRFRNLDSGLRND